MLSNEVVKLKIVLQSLGWYLLSVVSSNKYLLRNSENTVFSITIIENVTVQVGIASGNHTIFGF